MSCPGDTGYPICTAGQARSLSYHARSFSDSPPHRFPCSKDAETDGSRLRSGEKAPEGSVPKIFFYILFFLLLQVPDIQSAHTVWLELFLDLRIGLIPLFIQRGPLPGRSHPAAAPGSCRTVWSSFLLSTAAISYRLPTRIIKNSSRLLVNMATNFIRSIRGTLSSLASSSTLWLNLSHDSSLFCV